MTEEIRLAVVETKVAAIEKNQQEMHDDLKKVLAILAENRGGWRMLAIVGGGGGIVGAALVKVAELFGAAK